MKPITTLTLATCLTIAQLTAAPQILPQSADFSQKAKPATIKILLQKKATQTLLETRGRYYIYNPYDGVQITSGTSSKREVLRTEEYGLYWGEKFPGIYQIRIVPGDSQSSILVNGTQYKGCVEIYAMDGKLHVVNEVDIESYLKSSLTSLFPQQLDEEVMNAVAIVARTHAYNLIAKNQGSFWHVDAEEISYQGNVLSRSKAYIDHAVECTSQAIMTFHGAPFAAAWTQDSAGRTVDFASVFRKALVSPPGVPAAFAAKERQNHKWNFSVPKHKLSQIANLSGLTAVDLFLVQNTSKVYAVKLSSGSQSNDVDFFTLQKVLGKNQLRSNDFTVTLQGDQVIFTGYGEGPGVGLCLFSAQKMSEKGEKASKILAGFFPNTQIQKVRSLDQLGVEH